jgi:hypothetical protein
MRIVRVFLPALLVVCLFSSPSDAAEDRIAGALSGGPAVTLKGNIHHKALAQYDQGPVDPSLKLTYVTLLTTPTLSQAKALKVLVAQQQDRKSPNYHKWLTPERWADRFGLSTGDVQKITEWLKSQGFTVVRVARGRNWIVFSGTASQMQSAFGAEIHHYNVEGEMHFANAIAPKIPAALSGVVAGFRGLDDFGAKPMNVRSTRANYYDNLFQRPDFIAPGDITTIYDINKLYTAGFTGAGQKLAIAGQTDVYLADLNDFRGAFGLTQISCTPDANGLITTACNTSNFKYILNGPDPGVKLSDLTEADLDLEWSGAIAKDAQIIYVNSGTANGVWDSWYYAVDNVVAPVISLSYGNCEFNNNHVLTSTGQPGPDEVELLKANSHGITLFNSSGDSGAAECDGPTNSTTGNLAVGGLAVAYPASSPEVTGVGGTAISFPQGFTSTYWGTTNGGDGGTAQSPPLPETAWNDDEELAVEHGGTALSNQQTYAIVSTGGGASNCAEQTADNGSCLFGFAQPSWQTVTVPGQASVRFSPDVSLLASPNYPGYIFCTATDAWIGGTNSASTCAPGGAVGITNALALKDSSNNPAPAVVGGTSVSTPVFAGIMTLINQYLSASGGSGNINPTLYTLAATPSNGAFHPVTTGDNNVYCVANTPSGTVQDPSPSIVLCPSAGIFGFSVSAADSITGYNLVTGLGSVDAYNLAVAWKTEATQPGFSLSPSTTLLSAVIGANSNSSTITITPQNGFSGAVAFACLRGLPSGATCTFTPPTSSTSTSLAIQTAASMTPVNNVSVVVTGTGSSGVSESAVTLTVTSPSQGFTLAPQNATYQVAQGSTATVTVILTPHNGFNSLVTFGCSDPAPLSNCTGPQGLTAATTVSFTVSTTAPTAAAVQPLSRKPGIFYAALLPGLLGIMLTAGSGKRSLRGMRLLGLIVVLGFSTLWLGSCGGSSGSSKNSGTPKGAYSVVVNATTGGSNPVTANTTINLQVD